MMIGFDLSALRLTKWHDYAIRFLLGGAITVVAGVIAKKYGAPVGGLFLAFPAIFPAAATLAQKHEIDKKRKHGLAGYQRGIDAAGAEAAGAAIGSFGLILFAVVFWTVVSRNRALAFTLALGGWAALAAGTWLLKKRALRSGTASRRRRSVGH
jgi:hypothetical protein